MKRKAAFFVLMILAVISLSACSVGDTLVQVGEALQEAERMTSAGEEQQNSSGTEESVRDKEEVLPTEDASSEVSEDEQTANPPTGNVYDYGDGDSAGDYLEQTYSSYQNGGIFDLGDKVGNVGVAFDNDITFFFEATQNVQSFEFTSEEEPSVVSGLIRVEDVNFDGYMDLLVPIVFGASNEYFTAFVYEEWSGYFVQISLIEDISNPIVDEEHKCITSFTHCSASDYEEAAYEWIDPYTIYMHKLRKVWFDLEKDCFMVEEVSLSTDGRIGKDDIKECTEDEVALLPSITD